MDNLLTKPVNQFTSEEKNQLIAALNSKKPSVQFSCTSLDDCSREDGLNLDLRHIVNTQMLPTFHFPNDISSLAPSDLLCQTLERISRVWVMNNEKSRRIIIDAILSEVLDNECNEKLHGYCEVKNDWNGVAYTGNVDYMFGSSPNFSVQSMDAFLLIVEAKYEWPALAVPQVLAEAGCLLKKRMASGKVN